MSAQQVTPELRQWIIAQAQAGHRPETVLESMRASGWNEDVAIGALTPSSVPTSCKVRSRS